MTPRDGGKGGFEFDPKGIVNAEVRLEMPDDSAGWFVVMRAEADRGLPTPLKPTVLLLAVIWAAVGRAWLKMATVCTLGMAAGRWGGKMKPVAVEKLALKARAAPSRKV